ncbi:pyridoxal phosphate-dependent decarboxylase family protein [Sciscionella marina]|uniref:pyridoxal phosphate-dependent decarboxylase family protein n=1 Tax=Sciscionella marina TaxID=508770 RepID=UPI0003AB4110|nr:pyridoxal-dependent decarboxylase [Sciscionella marina]
MDSEAPGDGDGFECWRDSLFLRPDGSNGDALVQLLRQALAEALNHQGAGPVYPRWEHDSEDAAVDEGHLREAPLAPDAVLAQLRRWLAGSVKVHHQLFAKNIIPPPSFVNLATLCTTSLFMPNGVTGEDAGETLSAELNCARALARLAQYDPDRAGGLFTFGGTATNLYAIKVGLSKAQPDHIERGIEPGVCVVGSWPAHYSHKSACAWLGIGTHNYLSAASLPDQTTDIASMEAVCRDALDRGNRLACIMGAGGTTSNMAVDDFVEISAMRDRLVEEYSLDYTPHIHADTVVGWAYLCFADYDLHINPLGFGPSVVEKLSRLVDRLKTIQYADSFGADFHKTGFAPYTSSMIVMQEQRDLSRLRRDGETMTPLFHDKDVYNPGTFTLETSRSAANMVATWVGLQSLGKQRLRQLLGHALETSEALRGSVEDLTNSGMTVINDQSYGPDVFIRCYPSGDPATGAENFSDTSTVQRINSYTSELFSWLSRRLVPDTEQIALSKTSAAFYTSTGEPVVALRIYSLNPHFSDTHAKELIGHLSEGKRQFDSLCLSVEEWKGTE